MLFFCFQHIIAIGCIFDVMILGKSNSVKKINLSKGLFWEIDSTSLDFDLRSAYVIERVAMRGTMDDWRQVIGYYGEKVIRKVLMNVRYLDDKTLNFMSVCLKVPKEEFRCYKFRQSNPTHFPY